MHDINLWSVHAHMAWSQKSGKSEISLDTGVKRNFLLLRNFWPIVDCQLFCFSE